MQKSAGLKTGRIFVRVDELCNDCGNVNKGLTLVACLPAGRETLKGSDPAKEIVEGLRDRPSPPEGGASPACRQAGVEGLILN
ncbi:MAG: hypothetical protein Q8N98_02980 [bacterium]|nr:hypothetical protein [bacterium]